MSPNITDCAGQEELAQRFADRHFLTRCLSPIHAEAMECAIKTAPGANHFVQWRAGTDPHSDLLRRPFTAGHWTLCVQWSGKIYLKVSVQKAGGF